MSKMTVATGLEHLKDGIDCQAEAARSLNKVRRAFPALSTSIQVALSQMDEVKTTLKIAELELKGLTAAEGAR